MSKLIFSILIIWQVFLPIAGQDLSEFNSRKVFLQAEFNLLYRNYEEALPLYKTLLEKDSLNKNLNYLVGLCYLNLPNKKDQALPYLKTALKESYQNIDPALLNNIENNALWLMGNVNNNYDIDTSKRKRVELNGFVVKNPNPDDNMAISGDGNKMVFMVNNLSSHKLFYTYKENQRWSDPIEINEQIGAKDNFFCSSLSFDGTRLYLTKYDNFESDAYISYLKDGKWSSVKKLEINSRYWETHASESADGNKLYFASNRPGGIGAMDIYYCVKNKKDNWSEAINMGNNINTSFNDDSPTILNNDNTLFFSSQGHSSSGGYDLFFSNKKDSLNWNAPQSVGYPINTPFDDLTYIPLTKESMLFYSDIASGSLSDSSKYKQTINSVEKKSFLKASIIIPDSVMNKTEIDVLLINSITGDSIFLKLDDNNQINIPIVAEGFFTFKTFYKNKLANEKTIIIPILANGEDFLIKEPLFSPLVEPLPITENQNQIEDLNKKLQIKENAEVYYTIQISAIVNTIDFKKFKELKKVIVSEGPDGFKRCTIGKYLQFSDAQKKLQEIKEMGFSDAFIRKTNTIPNYKIAKN